jgi:hypothetical protein
MLFLEQIKFWHVLFKQEVIDMFSFDKVPNWAFDEYSFTLVIGEGSSLSKLYMETSVVGYVKQLSLFITHTKMNDLKLFIRIIKYCTPINEINITQIIIVLLFIYVSVLI